MEKTLNIAMAILMAAVCLAAVFFSARAFWYSNPFMGICFAGIAYIAGWLAATAQPNEND